MAKKKPLRCPVCESQLGELPVSEGKGKYYCDTCATTWDTSSGELIEVTEDGKEIVVAFVRDAEQVPEEVPLTYDVYFMNDKKRRYQGIVGLGHNDKGWMMLTTKHGKEILINATNVTVVEEI